MYISYSSVIKLLQGSFLIHSLDELKATHSEALKNSLPTAQIIEDYDYLSVMTGENSALYANSVFIYDDTKTDLPIILEQNKDLTLHAFSRLFCDVNIGITHFYKIIEEEAAYQDLESASLLLQFDMYAEKITNLRKLTETKIQRNDPCPCKSGQKFKNCHGKTIAQ